MSTKLLLLVYGTLCWCNDKFTNAKPLVRAVFGIVTNGQPADATLASPNTKLYSVQPCTPLYQIEEEKKHLIIEMDLQKNLHSASSSD